MLEQGPGDNFQSLFERALRYKERLEWALIAADEMIQNCLENGASYEDIEPVKLTLVRND